MKDTIGTEHTNLNVRTQATTSSTKIHTTKKYSNQSFIILGKENDFYKVQSDAVLTDDRSSIASVGNYDYDKMYVFVSANYVEVVFEHNHSNQTPAHILHIQQHPSQNPGLSPLHFSHFHFSLQVQLLHNSRKGK